ncbi:uncharacterized protein N7498_000994 [Penicillium cinerascens]|uniref:Uncharacterized protein n=1 Tax=Penicillium cinerascens TaxID=70096 RepID=A0A9W9NFB4_9EURO|nr:uncharacterized protein N7498_000994 [Penicillium cinerascens]KAJ5218895.1 hypothetical protein N7498_000994 [Penicillium cinerascens]
MVGPSFGGRREQYKPRADGPFNQQVGYRPNYSTNGPGGEPGMRYNSRNCTNQNPNKNNHGSHHNHKNHKNNGNANSNNRNPGYHYQGGRNFHSNGNQAAGLPRFPRSGNADESYRPGNNFHRRVPPSGPRSYHGQDQGYNQNHPPGQHYGPREYRPNQHAQSQQGPRQYGYKASSHQNDQQFDGLKQGPNRRRRGGRNRCNNQIHPTPMQLPLLPPLPIPETSDYSFTDDLELFEEPIEPFVPILGPDGMYYDCDGDVIIEDAPETDIVQIVTEGTVEMAKITQSLLESITTWG